MFVPTIGRCSCGFGDRGRRRRVTSPSAGPPTTPPCGHDLRPRDPRRRFRTATEVVFVPTAWRLRRLRVVVSERPRPAGNLGGGGRAPAVQDEAASWRAIEFFGFAGEWTTAPLERIEKTCRPPCCRRLTRHCRRERSSEPQPSLPVRRSPAARLHRRERPSGTSPTRPRSARSYSADGYFVDQIYHLARPAVVDLDTLRLDRDAAAPSPGRRRTTTATRPDYFAAVGFRPADLRRNAAVMEDLVLPAQHLLTNYSGLRMRGHIRANTPDDLQARWWSTLGGGGGAFAARADVGPCAGRRIGSNARSSICGPTSPTTPPSSRAPSRRLSGNTFPGWASPTSMTSWWRWRMVAAQWTSRGVPSLKVGDMVTTPDVASRLHDHHAPEVRRPGVPDFSSHAPLLPADPGFDTATIRSLSVATSNRVGTDAAERGCDDRLGGDFFVARNYSDSTSVNWCSS